MSLSARFTSSALVPRGALEGTSFVDQCGQTIEPPGETNREAVIIELKAWAREVEAVCGPRLFGRVPDDFVGPPVSGRAVLSRLA
jgi:hypothetical protein